MKTVSFPIDDALAEKFELARKLSGDSLEDIGERLVKGYVADALRKAASEFDEPGPPPPHRDAPPPPPRHEAPPPPHRDAPPHEAPPPHRDAPPRPPYGRPNQDRPPRPDYWEEWQRPREDAAPPRKILRAYWGLRRETGHVTAEALRARCTDAQNHPDTFVPDFDTVFARMKAESPHGKVFEERDGVIEVMDSVADALQHFCDYFI